MKSIYDQMISDPKFKEFMEKYRLTANYYVASNTYAAELALKLCMAAAFEAGVNSTSPTQARRRADE